MTCLSPFRPAFVVLPTLRRHPGVAGSRERGGPYGCTEPEPPVGGDRGPRFRARVGGGGGRLGRGGGNRGGATPGVRGGPRRELDRRRRSHVRGHQRGSR